MIDREKAERRVLLVRTIFTRGDGEPDIERAVVHKAYSASETEWEEYLIETIRDLSTVSECA